jgi:hypothetical protein
MSKEERRRKRQEQHEQEVDATVDKLELMQKKQRGYSGDARR